MTPVAYRTRLAKACERRIHPGAYNDFNYLSILRRVKNTLGPAVLFICCDETDLGIAKEAIKKEIGRQFGMELFFKSDFVPADAMSGSE